MKRWHLLVSLIVAIGLGVYFLPEEVSAEVNPSDVNSVMNGLVTQQSINQTNKPQFSDHFGTSETIDPASGKLVWKQTQISLPGRDGLDLNIGVMYDLNNAFPYMKHYGSQGGLKRYNYLNSRYDLGIGWSFQFPSIQHADGYMYYHKGDGAVYQIDFNATDAVGSYTHLRGYQGKDLRVMQDFAQSFYNQQEYSSYYLEYADKTREYFASDGRLLGIQDRFGNTITFRHTDRQMYDGQTYKVISRIFDTAGREVTFTYDSTLQTTGTFDGERIVVTVKDSGGIEKQRVTYMKGRSTLLLNNNPAGYSPTLWYIEDQINERTYFAYDSSVTTRFSYYSKNFDNNSGYNSYLRLAAIHFPSSITRFQYDKVIRNLGSSGVTEEWRATSRYDQLYRAATPYATPYGDFNHISYLYTKDYSGYPDYYDTNNLPASYQYSMKSAVQSSTGTNGLETTTTFNGDGQVVSVESKAANGERKLSTNQTFHPTFTSLPLKVHYSDGVTELLTEKQYTDWGGLQRETRPLSPAQFNDVPTKERYTTTYTYDPNYYFIRSKTWYQNNNTLLSENHDYYANGRLRSYTNPKGEVTSYCYETTTGSSNCSDPNASLTGMVTKVKESKSLGNGKTAVTETFYKPETNYTYPGEQKSYFTNINVNGQTTPQVITKTMSYYMGTGLLHEVRDSNGNRTAYEYDGVGRVTRQWYPPFTNLNGETYEAVDEYQYLTNYYSYDYDAENAGLLGLQVQTYRKYNRIANNQETILSQTFAYYDPFGSLRLEAQWDAWNGVSNITQFHYDDLGRPTYQMDPAGNTVTVAYDNWGRQKEATDAFGNLYVNEYLQMGRKQVSYFVAAGDLAAYRANPGQSSLKSSYAEQEFDQWGQHVSNKMYKDWPNQSQPITETYHYDISGNVVGYIDPKRNLNNEGLTAKYSYDALNRLTAVIDALGQITNYQYDATGQIMSASVQQNELDSPKLLNTKAYNEIGALQSKTDPSSQTEKYAYNNLGLVQQNIDRNGTVFDRQYDQHYRNTLTTVTGTTGVTQQQRSITGSNGILMDTLETYKNGVKTSSQIIGMDYMKRPNSVAVDASNYYSWLQIGYDKLSRINSISSSNGGTSFTTLYQYNRDRLEKVQVNGQGVQNGSDVVNVRYDYYPNGQVKSVIYPPLTDGTILTTEYTYNALNRVESVKNKKGSEVLSAYTYLYDDNGNIVTISETGSRIAAKSSTYTYDKLNRLETVNRSDGSSAVYTYDLRGNRLTLSLSAPHEMNVLETSYNYDLFNTLTSVTKGAVTTTFDYGPDGMRYKKTSGGNVTQYQYNVNREVIAEVDGNNQTKANYVRGDRLLVKKDVSTNKDYYYLYNGHGDVVQIVDTSGQQVNAYGYDEWGNITTSVEGIANPFKYTGEVYDEETGLYYLRARYYDPSMGRFINEDTYEGQIDNPLSQNLYTYVHNNPLRYVDPSGHYCVSANGDWAHGGDCNSESSIYLGDDSAFQGREIIENGVITGYLGISDAWASSRTLGNYWENHYDDKMIFKEHSLGYTIDAVYGNASQVPIWDDPLLYLAEGGALIKGAVKGLGKLFARQAAKESAEVIVKEVSELGGNKIHHILQEHHMWGKVVSDPSDWSQVSAVMSRTMAHGVEGPYKNVFMKTLRVGDETVVVTYTRLPNGTIKISDGWVAK